MVSGWSSVAGTRSMEIKTAAAEPFRKRIRCRIGDTSSEGGGAKASCVAPRKRADPIRTRGAKVKGRALKEARDSGKLAEEGGTRSPHDLKSREKRAKFEEVVMAAIASVRQKKLRSSKEKAAQEAAASIMAAAAATFLESEPESGNEGMRADIARLSTEVERLSRENAELKSSRASALVQSSRPVETPPEVSAVQPADRSVPSARFAVLEGIVLRPPLAGSKKAASYAAAAAPQPTPGTSGPTSQSSGPSTRPTKPSSSSPPPPPPASQRTLAADKPKKAKAARRAAKPAELAETAPPPTLLPADDAGWTVVGAKERTRRTERRKAQRQRAKERSVANMLRAPKSAAVVVTLQPEAVKKGVTYADLLSKAKGLINPAELGIAGGLRLRVTATGARKLELPGASSGPVADALAAKLRAAFDAAEARVSRPVKSVSLRISGLDDSVTVEEVVAAIVRTTGCSAEELKPGALRPDYAGMLAITVSCPVTAAKVVAEGRRLWCTSEVDRSALCFRCGQPGHKIGSCTADKPHCLACAAVGKLQPNTGRGVEPAPLPPIPGQTPAHGLHCRFRRGSR
ncbi:microtubule-associated protein futsch-like [Manduca sexta]|uniref:microtubule-associated protein futsch-like n=1 Tax=Manduca sexta TaxID=7130 RepID=UPI00188E8878|nr:microtubule-associated protein futsch-like [Manduca sexta]